LLINRLIIIYMKINIVSLSAITTIVIAAFVAGSLVKVAYVAAQTSTTSTETSTSTDVAPVDFTDATSSTPLETPESTTSAAQAPEAPVAPPPSADSTSLTLTVTHKTGTKYIDYCTDGTKVVSQPGDPAIDANFGVPDAPIPHCPNGMTWHHTSGMEAYDTATGDLEIGQYAQQSDGSYVVHYPAMTYHDATSTVQWPDRVTIISTDPSVTPLPSEVSVTSQE
jgi:hypothetical protein